MIQPRRAPPHCLAVARAQRSRCHTAKPPPGADGAKQGAPSVATGSRPIIPVKVAVGREALLRYGKCALGSSGPTHFHPRSVRLCYKRTCLSEWLLQQASNFRKENITVGRSGLTAGFGECRLSPHM